MCEWKEENCDCDDEDFECLMLIDGEEPEEYKGHLIYDEWFEGEIAYIKPKHRTEQKISYFRFDGTFEEGVRNLRNHIDESCLSQVSPNQLSLFDVNTFKSA